MQYLRKTLCVAAIFAASLSVMAQKKVLSETSFTSWQGVTGGELSPDGQYAFYHIIHGGYNIVSTVITSTDNKKKIVFKEIKIPVFDSDGQYLYGISGSALIRLKLSMFSIDTLGEATNFNLLSINNVEHLLFIDSVQQLHVINTDNLHKTIFANVIDYWTSNRSDFFVYRHRSGSGHENLLTAYYPRHKRTVRISSGADISSIIFNDSGNAIAFYKKENDQQTIWTYDEKNSLCLKLIDESSLPGYTFSPSYWQFSPSSRKIFFSVKRKDILSLPLGHQPEIWNYENSLIYPDAKEHLDELSGVILYSVDVLTKGISSINRIDEKIVSGHNRRLEEYILTEKTNKPLDGKMPRRDGGKTFTLVNSSGTQRIILSEIGNITDVRFSPDRRYLVYFETFIGKWVSYDLQRHIFRHFAEDIRDQLGFYRTQYREVTYGSNGIAAWSNDSDRLILRGARHLWEVSITNQFRSVDLTPEKDSNIVLSFSEDISNRAVDDHHGEIVFGMNLSTMEISLYKLTSSIRKFTLLYRGRHFWAYPQGSVASLIFSKTEKSDGYLFLNGNTTSSPNYCFTKDFRQIDTLSAVHPERDYNWLRSELCFYMDSLGNKCQGILYKPENFDPEKKYPVLLSIYQDQSRLLHQFLTPELPGAGINIPLMVSNGYLVFLPDIYMKKGSAGQFIALSVHAAIDHLAKYTWADTSRLGILGHSVGGGEVNYLLTKTNRFKAALSVAGMSSMVNNYNDLWRGGKGGDKQGYVIKAYAMSGALEKAKNEYLDFSPIMNAETITTPLLLSHNDKDQSVDFYHSTQFFVQLRSLGKPCWLLNYSGEGHVLNDDNNVLDYHRKINGFFDYYLSGKARPSWMKKSY